MRQVWCLDGKGENGSDSQAKRIHVRFHADLYKCPECGKTVLITADQEDPYIEKPEIVWLKDEEEEIPEDEDFWWENSP